MQALAFFDPGKFIILHAEASINEGSSFLQKTESSSAEQWGKPIGFLRTISYK